MDGPISTNESAGSAQQAGFVPVRALSVGPPDKVPPVSEDSRSRSTARDEVGVPGKTYSASSGREKAEQPVKEKTQEPAYFVEFPLPSGERESAAVRSAKQHLAEAEPEEGQEPLSLAGDPSQPKRYDDLSDLLEAAKRRWTEVNQDALDRSIPPGPPHDPMLGSGVQRQLATRYQSFAMALSNPHQSRPIVDLFV